MTERKSNFIASVLPAGPSALVRWYRLPHVLMGAVFVCFVARWLAMCLRVQVTRKHDNSLQTFAVPKGHLLELSIASRKWRGRGQQCESLVPGT